MLTSDGIAPGFDYAKDLAEQLITIATGLLGLSVTFTKELVRDVPEHAVVALGGSWTCLLVSIVMGLWELAALTGSAAQHKPLYGANITLPAAGQMLFFLLGLTLLLVYGAAGIRQMRKPPAESPPSEAVRKPTAAPVNTGRRRQR